MAFLAIGGKPGRSSIKRTNADPISNLFFFPIMLRDPTGREALAHTDLYPAGRPKGTKHSWGDDPSRA
jgi:hypothetical protein